MRLKAEIRRWTDWKSFLKNNRGDWMFKKLVVMLAGAIVVLVACFAIITSVFGPAYAYAPVFVAYSLLVIMFTYFGVKYILEKYCNEKISAKK